MNHAGHNPDPHAGHTMDHSTREDTVGDPDHSMSMMKMFWHMGYEQNMLIFGWNADTDGKMVAAVVVVLALAVVYEGTKFYRIKYSGLRAARAGRQPVSGRSDADSDVDVGRRFPVAKLTESLLYGVQVAISFTLMLIVMTFNVWLMLAAVVGMTLGYALFASSARVAAGGSSDDCCS